MFETLRLNKADIYSGVRRQFPKVKVRLYGVAAATCSKCNDFHK